MTCYHEQTTRAMAKLPNSFECGMRLLDSVEMCKKASEVLVDVMGDVSENFPCSSKSQAVHKSLKKVLEALGLIQHTVDTCIVGVIPASSDV